MAGYLRPNQEYWFLTEDGLYEVLMQSRKPKAKEFKKEVKKILKSIRKTGGYVVGQENMMQHRTYERHRSCTFFFYVRPSRGHFQLYRMITLHRKKLDSKKRKKI
nr:BRO family protein [uncultured Blautia sp.]